MSWGFKRAGKKAAVSNAVKEDKYIPDNVKALVCSVISGIPDEAPGAPWNAANGVFVEGCGHDPGSVGNLKIEPLRLDLETPASN